MSLRTPSGFDYDYFDNPDALGYQGWRTSGRASRPTVSTFRPWFGKVFRRTWSTLAHLHSMADALTQAQAGHTDPQTTLAYIKPTIEPVRSNHSVGKLPTAVRAGRT